jgi:3-oxoacyl-[acyl-carrier-protein] synthase III
MEIFMFPKVYIKDFTVCPFDDSKMAMELLLQKDKILPDVVIMSSTHPEPYGLWSRSASLIRDFGLNNCHAFDVKNGCNGGNIALGIGKNILITDPRIKQVLIVVDDQLYSYVDREDDTLSPFHSWQNGASAILLSKDEGSHELLGNYAITDARFADNVRLFPQDKTITLDTTDETEKEIGKIYRDNYLKVISGSLQSSDLNMTDCKALCMNQGDWKLRQFIQKETNIPWIQDSHSTHGHLGGSDVFYGLEVLEKDNLSKTNDYIVLASSGLGYSWTGQVVRKI